MTIPPVAGFYQLQVAVDQYIIGSAKAPPAGGRPYALSMSHVDTRGHLSRAGVRAGDSSFFAAVAPSFSGAVPFPTIAYE